MLLLKCDLDSSTSQHIGRLNNIKSVLGDNPLLWCCPLPAHGDGLSYRISDDAVNNGKWVEMVDYARYEQQLHARGEEQRVRDDEVISPQGLSMREVYARDRRRNAGLDYV